MECGRDGAGVGTGKEWSGVEWGRVEDPSV